MRVKRFSGGRVKISKKQWVLLLLVAALIIVSCLVLRHFSSPAQGTIQNLTPTESQNAVTTSVKVINSKYFVLTYPGRYINTENTRPSPGLLEYWLLKAPLSTGIGGGNTIGITVKEVSGSFTEESSYQRYLLNGRDFRIALAKLGNNSFTHVNKISGGPYEEAAYLQKGKILLVIVASSQDQTNAQLTTEFNAMLQGYKWII